MDCQVTVHIEKLPENFSKEDYAQMVNHLDHEPIEERIGIQIDDLDNIRRVNSAIADLNYRVVNAWRSIDTGEGLGYYRAKKVKLAIDALADAFDSLTNFWQNELFLNIYGTPVKPYPIFKQNLDTLHTQTIFATKWNQKQEKSQETIEQFFKKSVYKALYQMLRQLIEFFKYDLYIKEWDMNAIAFNGDMTMLKTNTFQLIHMLSDIVNDLNVTILARLHHIIESGKDVDEYEIDEQKINQLKENFKSNKEIIENINKIENKSKRKVCSCDDKQMEINKTICEYLDVVDGKCKKENMRDDRVVEVVQSLEKKIDQFVDVFDRFVRLIDARFSSHK